MRGHHTVLVGRALDIPPAPRVISILSPRKDIRKGKVPMGSDGYKKLSFALDALAVEPDLLRI